MKQLTALITVVMIAMTGPTTAATLVLENATEADVAQPDHTNNDDNVAPPPTVLPATAFWLRAPLPVAPGDDVIGPGITHYTIRGDETLIELARAFDMGYQEMASANNDVDPWLPPAGHNIRVPSLFVVPSSRDKWDLLVNIPEMRIYHRVAPGHIETFPIGVGREGFTTPIGSTIIASKKENPAWYVPASIRKEKPDLPAVVPPGPENPLGSHALYLAFTAGNYRIHGTHRPLGVGRRVSHGCIRLYPEDIRVLYERVAVGSRVVTVDQPVKTGWRGNALFLEIHPMLSMMTEAAEESGDIEADDDEQQSNSYASPPGPLPAWIPQMTLMAAQSIQQALGRRPGMHTEVDWDRVNQMVLTPDGVPQQIGQVIPS
ncbi:MAG: L,D-transpeptidase family protein, partial [Magnetococcales bacterium]|nr:L,D-transpeptidase family protein [Magnetococcales bacterium]